MNIHEYQAKGLLRSYGAPVSDGRIVVKSEDAKTAAGELDGPIWVVKAQIHAGGRGKGSFKEQDAGESGGVRIATSVEQAAEEAKKMLGRTLVTHQTGPTGKQVNRVYIEQGAEIERDYTLLFWWTEQLLEYLLFVRLRVEWILKMLLLQIQRKFYRSQLIRRQVIKHSMVEKLLLP